MRSCVWKPCPNRPLSKSPCNSVSPPQPAPALAEASDPTKFVRVVNGQLDLGGEPFTIKGLNYYPRQAPWERFWDEADPAAMAEEMALIREAGFNTLRVFLWYQPLFTCQPEDAIPNEDAFALLGTLFRLAEEHGLKLIVDLNDLPDLVYRPLYTDFARYDAQTTYIVRRYRHAPSLLAWDVRNAPDHDFRNSPGSFDEMDVLKWVAHITSLIREHDPHHLITAGWDEDPRAIEPYVDILSFQHWDEPELLVERVTEYREDSPKPLLMIATGEHTWSGDAESPHDENIQATYLGDLSKLADENGLGWLIWTAFDFVPPAGHSDNNENFHYGLWRTDLSPKSVLEALPLQSE